MTSEPKAPGVAAVYLDIEENDGLEAGVESFHTRIKVLMEKGKELATVQIPYWKDCEQVALVKGRTIHPDGTIVQLAVKPKDLLVVKSTDEQFGRKVFTLPGVDVGSILEYEYQLQSLPCRFYQPPSWDVQKPYFIRREHNAYAAPEGPTDIVDEHGEPVVNVLSWSILPKGTSLKMNAAGHFVLDMSDVPPIPNEEWMPPAQSLAYRVKFLPQRANSGQDFWVRQARLWSQDLDDFIAPTRTIRSAVANLVAPGDGDMEKARKIYAAVQALDNTDFSRQKTSSERRKLKLKDEQSAEDVWTQKSGSSDEIAMLYLSMLRAAGLTTYAMRVVNREQNVFDPTDFDMDQFNDLLVILSVAGKETYLDPGQKMCPFGMLSWKHAGAGGIRESADGHELGPTPSTVYTENSTLRVGDLNVGVQGAVTGDLRFVMKGQEALRWRQAALQIGDSELKKQFDEELQSIMPSGVDAHVNHFVGLNDPNSFLIAMIDVKGKLGSTTAKRLVLPAFFLATRDTLPFVHEAKRQTAVDMRFSEVVNDQLTYHLPPELTLDGKPADSRRLWKDHSLYTAKIQSEPDQITAVRSIARAFTIAKPEEYEDLRSFYEGAAQADQEQLVFGIATGPKSK